MDEKEQEYQAMCHDISKGIFDNLKDKEKKYKNKENKDFDQAILIVLASLIGNYIGNNIKPEFIDEILGKVFSEIEEEAKKVNKDD